MRYVLPFLLALLAACGAEAPPRFVDRAAPGVTVSGEARIGVRTQL